MKAITLTQPWATLVALGKKKIETRSWSTDYRGPLAIHAAKGFPDWARQMCHNSVFADALELAGIGHPDDLPLGVVVATCELVKVERITMFIELPPDPEFQFGNYEVGRYLWHLANIKRLKEPVPARGALSLWEWDQALLRSKNPTQT